MKTLLLRLLIFLFPFLGSSQTIEKFSIDNGGASASTGNINMLYTIGEVNVHELTTNTIKISEGFINGNSNTNSATKEDNTVEKSYVPESFDTTKAGIEYNEATTMEVKLYPNPTTGIIHITSNMELNKIELFDIAGKRVMTVTKTNEIYIEHLKEGAYIMKIASSKGQLTKKIIKN